jgi:wyosine [tRNA(Phe)-imidazoG37] synthetase (radical SAM superfamily)
MNLKLNTNNHSCDVAGLKYVYPVISRRTGGVSIGINFNTNNACNWRCIYCQVPNLTLGSAPEIDFTLLQEEFTRFLEEVNNGEFFGKFAVAQHQRLIKDIAIAGNGEPTSVKDFSKAVDTIGQIATKAQILPSCQYVLITNGSLLHKQDVQRGLEILNSYGGEVWFKLDSVTKEGRKRINNTAQSMQSVLRNLKISAGICPTKIQTCLFDYDNQGLSTTEEQAFLHFLTTVKTETNIKQIMLYTLARPSLQPESKHLNKLPEKTVTKFSLEIKALGFEVSCSI